MRLPLFIVLEGIDGSGKSSAAKRIAAHFSESGVPCVLLGEPTAGSAGTRIRTLLKSSTPPSLDEQMNLFLEDRAFDMEQNIRPALKKNMLIIMDRYYYSNAAYQGAMGLDPVEILRINRDRGFAEPDRIYFLDIPVDSALERIGLRNSGDTRECFEKKHTLEKVRQLFLSFAGENFIRIDASPDADSVAQAIIDDISRSALK